MSNWFLENPEDEETTETDQQLRDKHIHARLVRAKRLETVEAMRERYAGYGYPI